MSQFGDLVGRSGGRRVTKVKAIDGWKLSGI